MKYLSRIRLKSSMSDMKKLSTSPVNRMANGMADTCGCRSPSMKLKNGNSWIV